GPRDGLGRAPGACCGTVSRPCHGGACCGTVSRPCHGPRPKVSPRVARRRPSVRRRGTVRRPCHNAGGPGAGVRQHALLLPGDALLDVPSGEVIARGLSMPHSPRWYGGRLWVLDSGNSRLAVVDEASGRLETVAELPGFTRGLDFLGRYAFVGLSQVRESAVF